MSTRNQPIEISGRTRRTNQEGQKDPPASSSGRTRGCIVIDATAQMSGGGVYLQELLPLLIGNMPDKSFVVYGHLLPKCSPSDASRVALVEVDLPTLKTNLAWPGIIKLLWRYLIFPFRAVLRRPAVVVTTANVVSPLFSLLRIPTVLCMHNLTPFHSPRWYLPSTLGSRVRDWALHRLTILGAKQANRVIAFSEYSRELLAPYAGKEKIAVVYHGCPHNANATSWKGDSSSTFLLVSHYFPYKRIEIAIRAVARFIQLTGSRDVRLIVQGRRYDQVYVKTLEALVRTLELQDSVTLGAGLEADALRNLYVHSRALIFPPIGENCPITLLEAMQIGIPVIAADCPPMPEICGEAAEYFHEGDPEACSAAMLRLWDSSEHCRQLSKTGTRRAGNFTWESAAVATAGQIRLAINEKC